MEVIIFLVATVGIAAVSWRSLGHPRSHGFYRFFVFEGVLILVLLNAHAWFRDPLSVRQLISWVLLSVSAALPILGLRQLRVAGGSPVEGSQGPEYRFERTSHLVTSGIYRYVRHPMYASLLYLTWGAFLKEVDWLRLAVAAVTSIFTYITARVEERETQDRFGESYRNYMRATKRFVPGVW